MAWEGGEGSEALWNALLCPESLPGALSSKHVFQTRANWVQVCRRWRRAFSWFYCGIVVR